jgi:hypothetical protein
MYTTHMLAQKIASYVGILIAIVWLITVPVFAHNSATDKAITATLHIDPGDSPIAGQASTLHFNFSESHVPFNFATCACMMTISHQGNVVFGKETPDLAFTQESQGIAITYVFPTTGIYHVVFHGTSEGNSFMLDYEINVQRGASAGSDHHGNNHFLVHHGFHIVFFGGAFLVGLLLTLRLYKQKKL